MAAFFVYSQQGKLAQLALVPAVNFSRMFG